MKLLFLKANKLMTLQKLSTKNLTKNQNMWEN